MHLSEIIAPQDPLRSEITAGYHADETVCIEALLESLDFNDQVESRIHELTEQLVTGVREKELSKKGLEALMVHYDLSTQEGIMLMCLAEALLRVPDKETEHVLIRDKLTSAEWNTHLSQAESSFVKMATWGLALTGKVLNKDPKAHPVTKLWKKMVRRTSEPVVRKAVREAMKVMSEQFVLGRQIDEALSNSADAMKKGYAFSYDMLGEAARTMEDADAYLDAYALAISEIGRAVDPQKPMFTQPSISVKLSALYPRYDFLHQEKAVDILSARLNQLSVQARSVGISLTVDAEEADRLDMSLDIIERVFCNPSLSDWEGLGMAVQAYQKRAPAVLRWVADLARKQGKHMRVRLVKGAYWDSEIKHAQEQGLQNYPVFTRKISTDVSYLACAKILLNDMQDAIYPQFATHNAYTVSAILTMLSKPDKNFQYEFQSLHGMGDALHNELIAKGIQCRVYAPVGSHEALLPYLVRRLLENGANSSFVNQIADKSVPINQLVQSPVKALKQIKIKINDKIPLPEDIFGLKRKNSFGLDISDYDTLRAFQVGVKPFLQKTKTKSGDGFAAVLNPANHHDIVGYQKETTSDQVEKALVTATAAFAPWNHAVLSARMACLNKAADLLEANRDELIALVMREAGKVLPDAIDEIREAVDFCRYYAIMAKRLMTPKSLPGYTGETNTLRLNGRGVFLCISPWNFPIAIFAGQVVAALVTGNCVIAKPAAQTVLVAERVVELLYEAGIPKEVLQLVPGPGRTIGNQLVSDERIAGVLFTGSTATAKHIQLTLAKRNGPIVPFIAETGGINAMIVDSTALPEQLVDDVVRSAFGSAGQRCSALRLLFIQSDIADDVIHMLKGAVDMLQVGDPQDLTTDIGPVIDKASQTNLQAHIDKMRAQATLIAEAPVLDSLPEEGNYILPCAFELNHIDQLDEEQFGPILHVIRYEKKDLDKVIDQINGLGYGLTFGIQSRIDETVEHIQSRIRAGNIYVNRNTIGAVVGVQPFGGQGLSGTGPKAGGPYYLLRLCTESTLTVNTTAAGGNASLMAMD